MWKYVQSTGDFFLDADYIESGYSGAGPDGKNKPEKECEKNIGPIPKGWYNIGDEINKPSPVALPLTADKPNYCNPARSGFLIHGDNSTSTASTGCIILSRKTREKIRDSDDSRLQVVNSSKYVKNITIRKFAKPDEL